MIVRFDSGNYIFQEFFNDNGINLKKIFLE
jgi:hypothetical protein